jgi:hypothetical protein
MLSFCPTIGGLVFNTTFKNNSVRYIVAVNLIGVEETGIPEDNHRLAADQ